MIGELAALGAALSWAVSAVLYRKALTEIRPILANTMRLASTSLILLASVAAIGKLHILATLPMNAVLLASISGIVGLGLGDTLYMHSLKLIGVSRAVPITCTYPLFSLIITVLFQDKIVTPQVVVAAIAIASGIWLLTKEQSNRSDHIDSDVLMRGALLALSVAMIWAVSITLINVAVTLPEMNTPDSAFALNTVRTSSVAAVLLTLIPLINRRTESSKMSIRTAISLVFGGIVALGLGWFLLALSFFYLSQSQAVPISSTSPLFAVIAGMLFLHERVTMQNVVGTVVIVFGIFAMFVV